MLRPRNGVREARHAAETLLSIVVVQRAARRGAPLRGLGPPGAPPRRPAARWGGRKKIPGERMDTEGQFGGWGEYGSCVCDAY
eukprot:gene15475-3728_t